MEKTRAALQTSEKEKRSLRSDLELVKKREELAQYRCESLKRSHASLMDNFRLVCRQGGVIAGSAVPAVGAPVTDDEGLMWEMMEVSVNATVMMLEDATTKMQDFSVRRFNCVDDYSYYQRIAKLKSGEAKILRDKLETTTAEFAAFKERMRARFGV
jgi:hypothetical protein